MEKFRQLGVIEPILRSIKEQKIDTPTEIQEKTIPLVLQKNDIIALSATGSGKTLAFGAGIIQNSEKKKSIQSLILTPTRELAEQVCDSLKRFSKYKQLEIAVIYGGVSINPQIDRLRYADIVVGTPGRILDHLERNTIKLGNVKTLVLDEADRMLDMGFLRDVEKIISQCPEHRQTLLFSATMSSDITRLAKRYMFQPVEVEAENYVDATKLKQIYYDADDKQKFSLLVKLLKEEKGGLVMVFCNTRLITDFVANNLAYNKIEAVAIHGGLSQDKRNKIMKHFNNQNVYVLVCTDVAARGLDIKGVSHVYNYDIPKDDKEYIHRIGRTARAGSEGIAISILAKRDHENFTKVLRNRELDIQRLETPTVEKAHINWLPKKDRGFGGNRGGGFGRNNDRQGRSSFGRGRDGQGRGGFQKRSDGDSRGGFGERKSFGNRDSPQGGFGERKSFGNRDSAQKGGFGERKSFGKKRFGERRSFGRR